MQKRILAIHDISCYGRCSLTVALPIISASGAECTVLPTAVLSTHTGGFTGFTFTDLTGDLMKIAEHWKSENVHFDYIYTGYLGSFEQIDIVENIIKMNPDAKVVIDPVMGDHGKLYGAFNKEFALGMAKLCRLADVVMPNVTEASFMTGCEYREIPFSRDYVNGVLESVLSLGCKCAILTGVAYNDGMLGSAVLCDGKYSYAEEEKVNGMYHGTGDVFGSALVGALAAGKDIEKANEIAVKYTRETIRRKYEEGSDYRNGVPFESCLSYYIDLLK